eukprot:1549684-Amphidinium_carterae.1
MQTRPDKHGMERSTEDTCSRLLSLDLIHGSVSEKLFLPGLDPDAQSATGQTALHTAILLGYEDDSLALESLGSMK